MNYYRNRCPTMNPLPRSTLSCILVLLLAVASHPVTALGQVVTSVSVRETDVRAGRSGECAIQSIPLGGLADDAPARLSIKIVNDFSDMTAVRNPAELLVLVGETTLGRVSDTSSAVELATTVGALRNRSISLRLADGGNQICSVRAVQHQVRSLTNRNSRTSFIVDGAVGAGLRSGGTDGTRVTGALGLVHADTANKDKTPWLLRWLIPAKRASGERLKAVVTVAGSEETLSDSVRTTFAHALVSPTTSAGRAGSGFIDYYIYGDRGSGMGTQGPRFSFSSVALDGATNLPG